ncbi:hypothetical protein IMZ48_28690 [Candidatus Bathyarchaeota archaeon]|nr:hypothetical protein [Candidatus Bathyarchaeota archaeon]
MEPCTLHSVFTDRLAKPTSKRLEMMHHLVHNCGCDINALGPLNGYPPKEGTALDAAVNADSFDGIRWLIENGADVLRGRTRGVPHGDVCAVDNDVLQPVGSAEDCERKHREEKQG